MYQEATQMTIVRMSVTVTLEYGQKVTYVTGIPVYFMWTSEHDVTVYGCEPRPRTHITLGIIPVSEQSLVCDKSAYSHTQFTNTMIKFYLKGKTYNGY